MRWTIGVLAILAVVAAVVFSWPHEEEEPFLFSSEAPNVGTGSPPLLPLEEPLEATLFLAHGAGAVGDPYRFCLLSGSGQGRPSCLFDVSLVGAQGELVSGDWYRVTARFSGAPDERGEVVGQLVSSSPPDRVRLAGQPQVRQSRFIETSEALSNWAVAHKVSGYLRAEGAYVWYLSDEATQAARRAGLGRIIAVWADGG
ncbi:MAG: hypothetical protein ACRDWA_16620 [Acidimicrobiia bacterium]